MSETNPPLAANDITGSPLVIGVSTRALFDLREEDGIFNTQGVQAYATIQRDREKTLLNPGAAFEVSKRLLALNDGLLSPIVEIVLLSRNSPDLSLRAFNSIAHYELNIKHGSFTSGRTVAPFLKAWDVDLFLSNEETDVRLAIKAGAAAAKLKPRPIMQFDNHDDEVRFAFDGDAVLFGPESDRIYVEQGLDAFLDYEALNSEIPMSRGPFGSFLHKLSLLKKVALRADGTSKVRIALVTARNAPAHERVIHTFRAWGTPVDEAHFVGRHAKGPVLGALDAHIFFDDQERHVLSACEVVPAGLVPGPHPADALVIPAA